MGKATAINLLDEGFRKEQFGVSLDSDFSGASEKYLEQVLLRAELWAKYKLGDAAYASATVNGATTALQHAFHQIVIAETKYAAALLWDRRAKFSDSGAAISLQNMEYLNRREYIAHATSAMDCAERALAEAAIALGISLDAIIEGSGFAVGHVETGRYPVASESALND